MSDLSPTATDTLDSWLGYLEALHPAAIDMGLERVAKVKQALQLTSIFPVVIVAGTNGKGSVCAMLAAMYRAAGYKVGCYTSPHLLRYNERISINLQAADDASIVASFAAVEAARGDVSLTYFEYGTLAAMQQFIAAGVDVAILEVGLGGRLDAVNCFEPDVAAVVSVDIDHQHFLGDDREQIGREKAGVYRAGKPALCADPNPPASLQEYARQIGAPLQLIGQDFGFQTQEQQWSWWGTTGRKHALPFPALRGRYQLGNATLAIAIAECLKEALPLAIADIKRGLLEVEWPGRFQVLPGRPAVVLDVGHNPHAVKALVASLGSMGFFENTYAVFGMMADKDIAGVVQLAKDSFNGWFLADLATARAASAAQLQQILSDVGVRSSTQTYSSAEAAWQAACERAGENDRIVVFGSFYTVAEVMAARSRKSPLA